MSSQIKPLTKNFASSLISATYMYVGSKHAFSSLKRSLLEDEIGAISEDKENAGYFRLLDEAIFLLHTLGLYINVKVATNPSFLSVAIVSYGMRQTATAIRKLEAEGFDSVARQNLRNLYEQALCLTRLCCDDEFRKDFQGSIDPQSANHLWHRYMAKGKMEKFLRDYSELNGGLQSVVAGADAEEFLRVLGPSAHPSMLSFQYEHASYFTDSGSDDSGMLELARRKSTEFVLFHTTRLVLTTVASSSDAVADGMIQINFLRDNPLFNHVSDDSDRVLLIKRMAGILYLMTVKAMNRSKSGFTPEEHF